MICRWKTVTFLLELLHCFWCNFRQRTWLIVLRVTNSACAVLHCLCRGMGLCWQGVKSAGTQTHHCSEPVTVERFCQSAAKPLPYKWLSQPAAAPGFGVRGTMCWGESCCIQALPLESLQVDQGFLYPSYLNKWRHHLFCVSFLFYFVFILCFEFFSFSHKEPNQTLPLWQSGYKYIAVFVLLKLAQKSGLVSFVCKGYWHLLSVFNYMIKEKTTFMPASNMPFIRVTC